MLGRKREPDKKIIAEHIFIFREKLKNLWVKTGTQGLWTAKWQPGQTVDKLDHVFTLGVLLPVVWNTQYYLIYNNLVNIYTNRNWHYFLSISFSLIILAVFFYKILANFLVSIVQSKKKSLIYGKVVIKQMLTFLLILLFLLLHD